MAGHNLPQDPKHPFKDLVENKIRGRDRNKYVSPRAPTRNHSRHPTPAVAEATHRLMKFHGYKTTSLHRKDPESDFGGTLDKASPALQLRDYDPKSGVGTAIHTYYAPPLQVPPSQGGVGSTTVPPKFELTEAMAKEAYESFSVYKHPHLNDKACQRTLKVKSVDGKSPPDKERANLEDDAGRRVTASTDYIIHGANFDPCEPIKCKIVAGCAPDVNSKKDHNRIDQYLDSKGNFDWGKYENEMRLRVRLYLAAFAESGVDVPIFPSLGSGDFAGDKGQKVAEIVATLMRQELERTDPGDPTQPFYKFKGVVFSMPDIINPNQDSENYKIYERVFAQTLNGKPYQGIPVEVSQKEMVGIAQEVAEVKDGKGQAWIPGLFIADHPTRRPGNGWPGAYAKGTSKDDHRNMVNVAQAQEETLTKHLGFYVGVHAHEVNPIVLDSKCYQPLNEYFPAAPIALAQEKEKGKEKVDESVEEGSVEGEQKRLPHQNIEESEKLERKNLGIAISKKCKLKSKVFTHGPFENDEMILTFKTEAARKTFIDTFFKKMQQKNERMGKIGIYPSLKLTGQEYLQLKEENLGNRKKAGSNSDKKEMDSALYMLIEHIGAAQSDDAWKKYTQKLEEKPESASEEQGSSNAAQAKESKNKEILSQFDNYREVYKKWTSQKEESGDYVLECSGKKQIRLKNRASDGKGILIESIQPESSGDELKNILDMMITQAKDLRGTWEGDFECIIHGGERYKAQAFELFKQAETAGLNPRFDEATRRAIEQDRELGPQLQPKSENGDQNQKKNCNLS